MNSIHRKFMTIPFQDGGRSFKGADCWGLVMLVFAEYGIILPDFKIACKSTLEINTEINNQRINWDRIDNPIDPCLVVFRLDHNHPKSCCHLGVYIGDGKIIHTFPKIGVSLTSIHHPYFKYQIEGYYVKKQ